MDLEHDAEWEIAQTLSFVYARNAMVATLTIVLLEYFQLFELESVYIWSSKWTPSKVLFVISRYLPLVYATLWVYWNSAPPDTSTFTCRSLFGASTATLIVGTLCADAVLYLRLRAVSKNARVTGIVLAINYTVVAVLCLAGLALFLYSEKFIPSPNLLPLTTCFHVGTEHTVLWMTICYGALLYSSLFTTTLSLWYGLKLFFAIRPMPPSTLVKIFYQDGAVYFVCISTISLVNAGIALFAPLQFRFLLPGAQGMVHSVLAVRMVLHIREVGQGTVGESIISTQDLSARSASNLRVEVNRKRNISFG